MTDWMDKLFNKTLMFTDNGKRPKAMQLTMENGVMLFVWADSECNSFERFVDQVIKKHEHSFGIDMIK